MAAFLSHPNVRFIIGVVLSIMGGQTLYDWARYTLYRMNKKMEDDND